MKSSRLGSTTVEVSSLGFGGAPIGNLYAALGDDDAHATVEAAWAGGVRYFDTAPHYGLGLSERRLGEVLADRPRAEFTISTKVGRLLVPNPLPTGSDLAAGFDVADDLARVGDYSGDGVRRSLEASLTRLGLDRVDIVYIHDPEEHMEQALQQAMPALVTLRDEGTIGAIGAGMNFVPPLRRFVTEADVDVILIAGRWTLLDRSAATLLDECQQRGISAVAAAPFNSGLLARGWPEDGGRYDYGPAGPAILEHARALARICQNYGSTLPHAAIQFPLQHPAVACVMAGMGTVEQTDQDVAWATTELPDGLLAALDDHWAKT
jgi:D-threo-aldose 1-dehydrogenase